MEDNFNIGDLVTYADNDIMRSVTYCRFGVIVDKAKYSINNTVFDDLRLEIYWNNGERSWTTREGLIKLAGIQISNDVHSKRKN